MSGGRPLVLVVIDGWGLNDDRYGNAIAAAATPVMDRLAREWPSTAVGASGEFVGLPRGQQGNSEVGHLTIGAGRVVFQDFPRITRAIETGEFFENAELAAAVDRARDGGGTLHALGLVSPGGVHSHQDHGLAIAELARRRGLERLAFHAFTDGRDEPPRSAAGFVARFQADLGRVGVGQIASVTGRYYAMDRDRRWERTRRAYDLVTGGPAAVTDDPVAYIEQQYAVDVTDEFIEPAAVVRPGADRVGIRSGDTVVFFNFRSDRARQLCRALIDEGLTAFDRLSRPTGVRLVTFTDYQAGLTPHVAFRKVSVTQCLAEVVSAHGLRQLHVAETEKYAHVTYFINGGREEPFAGEERVLVPSPKVATYDQTPRMSADAITDLVLSRVERSGEALIVVNFANPDMVGHTGDFDATVQAVECVDACIGRIADAVLAAGATLIVTADHGNAELKIERRDGSRLTAHTTSPVPVIVCGADRAVLRPGGGLADVAPTALGILGLPVPDDMTGSDLRAVAVSGT